MKAMLISALLICATFNAMAQGEIGLNAGLVSVAYNSRGYNNSTIYSWCMGVSLRIPTKPKRGFRIEVNLNDQSSSERGPEGFMDIGLIGDYRADSNFGFHYGSFIEFGAYGQSIVEFNFGGLAGLSYSIFEDKLTFEARAHFGLLIYAQAHFLSKLVVRYNFPVD